MMIDCPRVGQHDPLRPFKLPSDIMPPLAGGSTEAADMSNLVSGINYNLLFSGETSSQATDAILTALYSGTSSSTPTTTFVSSGNPITDLKLAQSEQTTGVAQEAQQPQVARRHHGVQDGGRQRHQHPDRAVESRACKRYCSPRTASPAISARRRWCRRSCCPIRPTPDSLVNQLSNPTWLSTVQTYNFAQNGLAELQNPQVISTLTNAYAEVQWREGLDQATPGLANALTFLSQASSIKSVDDVLANDTNFQVITTALGIPADDRLPGPDGAGERDRHAP